MKQRELSIAKITRPRITGVYERKRLFQLLDQGRDKPVVWISGPAGSGKTTLAASWLDSRKLPCLWYQVDEGDSDIASFFYYLGLAAKKAAPRAKRPLPLLTPEYAFGIPTFTRRFFEYLYSRFSLPFVVVFDNYQHISEASPLHEVMQIGLSIIPEGITVAVISRTEPPPMFSELRANNRMEVIGWDALRLTPEESRGIVRLEKERRLSVEATEAIHEKAGGWAAGLILMAKRPGTTEEPRIAAGTLRPEEIFDYFATVLFDKTEERVRDFLIKTSVLPRMTAALATKLTGISHADRILDDLNRRNYFTEKRSHAETTYQYHPLFRHFLLSRAQGVLSAFELKELRIAAGQHLEQAGQIEDAAELYQTANDPEGLTRMIIQHAPALVRQGRYRTLEHWLLSVPPDILARNPRLLFWLGVCSQPMNPREAREKFQLALSRFQEKKDTVGELLAWSGIVETFLYEWNDFTPLDRWIRWLDDRARTGLAFSSADIEARVSLSMAAALMVRRPDHPKIGQWWERALALVRNAGDVSFSLQARAYAANYYFWIGDVAKGTPVVREISSLAHASQGSPLAQLTWKWLEAAIGIWALMPAQEALTKISAALAYADSTGVHVWDHMLLALGVYGSLMIGDHARARQFIQSLERTLDPSRRHGYCHYHYLIAWERQIAGDAEAARSNAGQALKLAQETGFEFPVILCTLETAQILLLRGDTRAAAAQSAKAYRMAVRSKSFVFEFMALLARAQVAFSQKRDPHGLLLLREGLRIGKKHGYFNQLWWHHAPSLSSLCSRAFAAGIEPDYVQALVRKHRLIPENAAAGGEFWPWPLKIYTLGMFRVEQDGVPLSYARKAPKKPLDLLRVLVALGGKNVSEGFLREALWPDAEGDGAQNSLSVTLLRLRELFGVKEALQVNEGTVSLDERYVWTDAREFETLVQDAEQRMRNADFGMRNERPHGGKAESARYKPLSTVVQSLERAILLYRGPFLDGEEQAWCIRPRERFRELHLRAVEALSMHWEREHEWRKAIEVYKKGIQVDDLIEKFYNGTIRCFLNIGSKSEALSLYRRLQKTFDAYGLEPSSETAALYGRIVKKR